MPRIIAAVALGYIAMGLLVVVSDQLFAAVVPGTRFLTNPPLYYFIGSLVTDSLYAVVGGWLCAKTARASARTAAIALIVFGEVIGAASQIALWNTVPHWFGDGLLLLYPPAVWLGYVLQSRNRAAPAPL
jgi:hypothetical protein